MTANQQKNPKEKAKPFLFSEFCKGCGRCIEACPKNCIVIGQDINTFTGLIPIKISLENCIGCSLCVNACPEPYALAMSTEEMREREEREQSKNKGAGATFSDPSEMFGLDKSPLPKAKKAIDEEMNLPISGPQILKGNYASAIGAILSGCRHFYGYPITPSTEGAELMAKLMPQLDGIFFQAVSEVATVNIMYGTGGAGLPSMTFTSSPGFSLMVEGISYMIGSEIPGVFINIMRGGPGLGNIAPEQSDIKLVCNGLGHGNTHAVVLAPSTPQEMLDLTMKAFELSFKYRNPVIVVADGYLGQMTGKVILPKKLKKPAIPEWAVYGDKEHRANLMCSIYLTEKDLEDHNHYLDRKYDEIKKNEQMADLYKCDDAEVIIVACNTPAQMAKGSVADLRSKGVKAGLFRPMTLWPFPIDKFKTVLPRARHIVVVEANSSGQLEDELRLNLNRSQVTVHPPIHNVRRCGGILPSQQEITEKILSLKLKEV
ncbi:MAG: 3-methyl-2-oxobutanoate dehydrogenase subunit VorB [Oligoflexia bacterium]|nr:3-methyl-2-oxobutanoate dehydrogenase subunit VorB [Oligoflexia bacterium]